MDEALDEPHVFRDDFRRTVHILDERKFSPARALQTIRQRHHHRVAEAGPEGADLNY